MLRRPPTDFDAYVAELRARGLAVTVGEPARIDPGHLRPAAGTYSDRRKPTTRGTTSAKAMPGRRAYVELPPPPTVNHLYANVAGRGRVKTKAYRTWIDVAGTLLNGLSVPPPPWTLRYVVTAGAGWPETHGPKVLTSQVPTAGQRRVLSGPVVSAHSGRRSTAPTRGPRTRGCGV